MPHVERAGIKVYYESFGRGPAIVLLHPITSNRYLWAHQLMTFAVDHRVVVVDHRGHGRSDKPAAGYAIAEMAADVRAILDAAAIDRAVLVGNSMGGMIALQLNLDAPERVLANVIISSGTGLAASAPPGPRPAFADDPAATLDAIVAAATSARTRRERPEVYEFLLAAHRVDDNFNRHVLLGCATDPGGVFHWDIGDRLAQIERPTLVLAGAEDRAMPVAVTRRLADGIPGAQFKVVADVGHYYPLEAPAEFNADLRGFLRSLAPDGSR
jgi:pimeloyl-ACP methyl ester carboxylesterase